MKHRRPIRPSLKIGAVALVVAGLGLVPMASNAIAASSAGGEISRAEALDRAQLWVNGNVVYSQNRTYPDPGNKRYRTDCSGYVAMAWHMTIGFVNTLASTPRSGTYLRDNRDGSIYLVVGGAKYPAGLRRVAGARVPDVHERADRMDRLVRRSRPTGTTCVTSPTAPSTP
jgi:hypothetical protein